MQAGCAPQPTDRDHGGATLVGRFARVIIVNEAGRPFPIDLPHQSALGVPAVAAGVEVRMPAGAGAQRVATPG